MKTLLVMTVIHVLCGGFRSHDSDDGSVSHAGAVTDSAEAVTSGSRMAVSTNIIDWGCLITPNMECQYAVGRHWCVTAGVRFNRWTFHDTSLDERIRCARQEYAIGVRRWWWYTYTGWWAGCRLQWREYSGGGVLAHRISDWSDRYLKEEGDAFGVVLNGGYSLQVNRWLNFDFGIGVWGGYVFFKQYSGESAGAVCPRYGRRTDAALDGPPSQAFFFGPAEVSISAMFIF